MMFQKKKRPIDSRDREILRLLHAAKRPLSGHQIAKKINLSPPAIKPRLNSLQAKGILKKVNQGKNRIFKRTFGLKTKTIIAPSRIQWKIDMIKKKKK